MMTKNEFQRAAGISAALADKWYGPILNGFNEFNVYSPLRMAHYIAQLGHESTGFTQTEEGLFYRSASRIIAVFRDRNGLTPQIASRLVGNPQALANFVYGGAWGRENLGNTQSNDGWDFRGSGPGQTTGRANHQDAADGLGVEIRRSAELMRSDTEYGARAASYFWWKRGIQPAADADDVTLVTKLYNGGLNGLDDRKALLARSKGVLC